MQLGRPVDNTVSSATAAMAGSWNLLRQIEYNKLSALNRTVILKATWHIQNLHIGLLLAVRDNTVLCAEPQSTKTAS